MKSEQQLHETYADLFDLLDDEADAGVAEIIGDLDALYTAPVPPAHLHAAFDRILAARTQRIADHDARTLRADAIVPRWQPTSVRRRIPQPSPPLASPRGRTYDWLRQGLGIVGATLAFALIAAILVLVFRGSNEPNETNRVGAPVMRDVATVAPTVPASPTPTTNAATPTHTVEEMTAALAADVAALPEDERGCEATPGQAAEDIRIEVRGRVLLGEGELWADYFPKDRPAEPGIIAANETVIYWKLHQESIDVPVVTAEQTETGTTVVPDWGPVLGSSGWRGGVWRTIFTLPEPGCWTFTVVQGESAGVLWIEVMSHVDATGTPVMDDGQLDLDALIAALPESSRGCEATRTQMSEAAGVEIQGKALTGSDELWVNYTPEPADDRIKAGEEEHMYWHFGESHSGSLEIIATHVESGAHVTPEWGPVAGSGSWKPGPVWKAVMTFPEPGCWQITVVDDDSAGVLWLEVAAQPPS